MPASVPPDDQSESGLSVGLTIVGRQFDEVTALQVAQALEKLTIGQEEFTLW